MRGRIAGISTAPRVASRTTVRRSVVFALAGAASLHAVALTAILAGASELAYQLSLLSTAALVIWVVVATRLAHPFGLTVVFSVLVSGLVTGVIRVALLLSGFFPTLDVLGSPPIAAFVMLGFSLLEQAFFAVGGSLLAWVARGVIRLIHGRAAAPSQLG